MFNINLSGKVAIRSESMTKSGICVERNFNIILNVSIRLDIPWISGFEWRGNKEGERCWSDNKSNV